MNEILKGRHIESYLPAIDKVTEVNNEIKAILKVMREQEEKLNALGVEIKTIDFRFTDKYDEIIGIK